MDTEIQKRNTDCVYFLASPLTCKKGSECEYRHSESARLNPRDCYYWLGGNCLNPNCSFRHPPLEGSADNPSDTIHRQNSTAPTNKTNVPCYYFFNAYCIKGDKCPFLHGNDIFLIQSTSRAVKQDNTMQVQEKNPSNRSGNGPFKGANASEGLLKEPTGNTHSDTVPEVALVSGLKEPSHSPELPLPGVEEPPVKSYDISGSVVEDVYKGEDIPSDQSSEELGRDHTDPDELGSSPGFDVLVDNESGNLAYEDDLDYGLGHDGDRERLHRQMMHYDFESSVGYDRVDYPDSEFLGDVGMHERFDRPYRRNNHPYDTGRDSESSREHTIDGKFSLRRDYYLGSDNEEECLDRSDLRHRLKRRRVEYDHSFLPYDTQRYRVSPRRDLPPRRERSWELMGNSNGVSRRPKLFPDLAELALLSSSGRHRALSNDRHRRRYMQNDRRSSRSENRASRARERQVKRKPFLSSEISGSLNTRERSVQAAAQPDTGFSRPKSLAEIKEDKRRREGNCRLAYPSD